MKKISLASLLVAVSISLSGCLLEAPNQMPPEIPQLPEVEVPVIEDEDSDAGQVFVPAYNNNSNKKPDENDPVKPFDKSELGDLRQFYLEDHKGVLDQKMVLGLQEAGLNDEQIDLMAKVLPLGRMGYDLANNLDASYYFLSGFTYDSFSALVNQLFTEYAYYGEVPAFQMFDAQNVSGQLRLKSTPPPPNDNEFYKVELNEVYVSQIKFDLYMSRNLTIEPLADDVVAGYGSLSEAYEAYNEANNYLWGENLYGAELDEKGTVKLIYRYGEKMSYRGGQWKFDDYTDWRM